GELLRARRGRSAPVRPAAVRSSALRDVLLRHDRPSEVPRARRRRHAPAALEGTPAPHRDRTRRSRVLFHDLRLDDVELARERAREWRDTRALRRIPDAALRAR